jgi:hypothetical protein
LTFIQKREAQFSVCCWFQNGPMSWQHSLTPEIARAVIKTLSRWQPQRRLERMKTIAEQRRLDVELVLENIVDDSNAVDEVTVLAKTRALGISCPCRCGYLCTGSLHSNSRCTGYSGQWVERQLNGNAVIA